MIADAEALELAVTQLPNETTVVDAGVKVPGSLEAGRLFAEVCLNVSSGRTFHTGQVNEEMIQRTLLQ